jgi:hypothetical protein
LAINQKEFLAAVQKLSLWRATWIYAFLFMNLMQQSKHFRQHLIMQVTILKIILSFI